MREARALTISTSRKPSIAETTASRLVNPVSQPGFLHWRTRSAARESRTIRVRRKRVGVWLRVGQRTDGIVSIDGWRAFRGLGGLADVERGPRPGEGAGLPQAPPMGGGLRCLQHLPWSEPDRSGLSPSGAATPECGATWLVRRGALQRKGIFAAARRRFSWIRSPDL